MPSRRHADTGVLNLAPLKRLALSARVVTFELRPQPLSAELLPARAEEELAVVAVAEASSTPPPLVPAIAIEEGQMGAEAVASQAALQPPAEAGPGGGDVVVVLDEDSVPPPSSGGRDVVRTPVSEPTPVVVMADPSPAAEVLELSRPLRCRILPRLQERRRLLCSWAPSPSKR
jgi:hypothetical protein